MTGDLLLDALRDVLGLGPEDPVPATITVEQAAKLLGISRGLAYEEVRDGGIPSVTLGRRRLVLTYQLLALLGGPGQGQPPSDGAEAALAGSWSFTPPEPDHLEAAS